jgi:hypothetical protein
LRSWKGPVLREASLERASTRVIRTSPKVGLPLLHACARLHIFNHAQKEKYGEIGKSVKKGSFNSFRRKKVFVLFEPFLWQGICQFCWNYKRMRKLVACNYSYSRIMTYSLFWLIENVLVLPVLPCYVWIR